MGRRHSRASASWSKEVVRRSTAAGSAARGARLKSGRVTSYCWTR